MRYLLDAFTALYKFIRHCGLSFDGVSIVILVDGATSTEIVRAEAADSLKYVQGKGSFMGISYEIKQSDRCACCHRPLNG